MTSTNCDGSQLGVSRPAYMSLPSPNIPCAEDEKKKGMEEQGWHNWNSGYDAEGEDQETSRRGEEPLSLLRWLVVGRGVEERALVAGKHDQLQYLQRPSWWGSRKLWLQTYDLGLNSNLCHTIWLPAHSLNKQTKLI